MESPKPQPQNLDEYSAATTVINFDRPIPLLRGPIHRPGPSSGPYVLAFRDLQTWFSALKSSESQILDQCVTGARIGCALTASNKCKPPWWRSLIGPKQTDLKAREQCEAREMEACFVTAKEKCAAFAAEKCATPFRDAWIAARVNPKVARRLIGWASVPERCTWINSIGLDLGDCEFGETNCYRASELLGSNTDFGSDRFKVRWTLMDLLAVTHSFFLSRMDLYIQIQFYAKHNMGCLVGLKHSPSPLLVSTV